MKIDVNSDMGEGFGVYQLCDDSALMDKVSSANIACGFHAGDPAIMTRMVRLAKVRGVGIEPTPVCRIARASGAKRWRSLPMRSASRWYISLARSLPLPAPRGPG